MLSREEAERHWTDEELAGLPPAEDCWNPFTPWVRNRWFCHLPAGETENPQTVDNLRRWCGRHDGLAGEHEAIKHPSRRSAFETIQLKLAMRQAGVHRTEHKHTGGSALFPLVESYPVGSPERKAQEDAWEKRSIAMHDAQKVIVLDDLAPLGYRAVSKRKAEGPVDYAEMMDRQKRKQAVQLRKEAEERRRYEEAMRREEERAVPNFEDTIKAADQRREKQLRREARERKAIERRLERKKKAKEATAGPIEIKRSN